jgi:hypothetical protein
MLEDECLRNSLDTGLAVKRRTDLGKAMSHWTNPTTEANHSGRKTVLDPSLPLLLLRLLTAVIIIFGQKKDSLEQKWNGAAVCTVMPRCSMRNYALRLSCFISAYCSIHSAVDGGRCDERRRGITVRCVEKLLLKQCHKCFTSTTSRESFVS